MTLPNFLIIGAAKSGTTSLYHYLRQHPDIFMSPVKEPNYFSDDDENLLPTLIRSRAKYEALFAGARGAVLSTSYAIDCGAIRGAV